MVLCRLHSSPNLFHGTDFDMTEYEVLGLEPLDSVDFQSNTTSAVSTLVTPSVTPPSAPTSTPSPPPTPAAPEQAEEVDKEPPSPSSSPQLRLSKRKAPEVPPCQ